MVRVKIYEGNLTHKPVDPYIWINNDKRVYAEKLEVIKDGKVELVPGVYRLWFGPGWTVDIEPTPDQLASLGIYEG